MTLCEAEDALLTDLALAEKRRMQDACSDGGQGLLFPGDRDKAHEVT